MILFFSIKSLHFWFKIVRSKQNVIKKFYDKNAFLCLCVSQIDVEAVKHSFDQLMNGLESLSETIKFANFDLFYECNEIETKKDKLSKIKCRPKSLNLYMKNDGLSDIKVFFGLFLKHFKTI